MLTIVKKMPYVMMLMVFFLIYGLGNLVEKVLKLRDWMTLNKKRSNT